MEQEILKLLKEINSKVDSLGERMEKRFSALEKRMEKLEERVTALEQRFSALEERVTALEEQVSSQGQELSLLRQQTCHMGENLTRLSLLLENDVCPNISFIADGHLDINRKMESVINKKDQMEWMSVHVMNLDIDVRKLKEQYTAVG